MNTTEINADSNYRVETAERGAIQTRMRDVNETDATTFMRQLIEEKIATGYIVIDRRNNNFVLMRDAHYRAFSIRIRHFVEVR